MNRETSLYLDLVRFTAAMVVLVGHLSGARFTGGLLWQFGLFMDDAVMVFFVLSGFVIAFVVHHKESRLEQYAIARAARIYSVALPALVATFALDTLGRQIAPELYTRAWGYHPENPAGQFLAGLVFVNQLWYAQVPTGSMLPYWSLGFEVWYYLFFAILFFARPRWRIVLFAGACAVAGPRIVAFFPIWMLGYLTYGYACAGGRQRSARAGLLLMGLSLLAYATYHAAFRARLMAEPLAPEWLGLDNLAPRYIVSLLFALHLVGFVWASRTFSAILLPLQAPIRWLAGATFTIYLFHIPVAQFLTTLMPWPPSDGRTRATILLGTLLLMFVIARYTERRKETWRRWIAGAFSHLHARLRVPTSR
ncbi:MAG: acyltransferase [Xylophilus ampelinus]